MRICDTNINFVVFCGQTLSGLSQTIDSFYHGAQRGGNCVTALIDVPPYELTPQDFALYLNECEKGTKFEQSFQQPQGSVCIFIQAGMLLNLDVLRYSTYFLEDSGCPLLYIPASASNEPLPDIFQGLPPGGITDNLSLLLRYNFVCVTTNPVLLQAGQYQDALIHAATAQGNFGVLKMAHCTSSSIMRDLTAIDLYNFIVSTGMTEYTVNIINDFISTQLTLPLDKVDENIELLAPYVSDNVQDRHSAISITSVNNHFSDVELEGFFYPEDKKSKLTVQLDDFEMRRIIETVQDKLVPRYFFCGKRSLVDNKTKIMFKQGRKNIKDITVCDSTARNYNLTINGNAIEIEKIAMRPYYKLTCVIPVYNAEVHLTEAVNSIVNSQPDFFVNTQIVLVNDGSIDSSHNVCQSLVQKYPYNIKYVQIEHSGVSVARNTGLNFAMGQYIMFVDADDTLDANLLQLGIKNLDDKKNADEDFIVFPIKMFGHDNLPDPDLEFRFSKNGVIDVSKEPSKVQFSACGVLMRASAVKAIKFDPALTIGEDAEFMYRALAEKQRYLVCKDAFYNYRIGQSKYADKVYAATELLADTLFSNKINGEVSSYAQHVIMHSLRRIVLASTPAPNADESDVTFDNAIASVAKALNYVSNETITEARHFTDQQKQYMLCLKHGDEYAHDSSANVYIDYMRERNGYLCINGYFCVPSHKNVELVANYINEEFAATFDSDDRLTVTICNRHVYGAVSFTVRIPLASIADNEVIELQFKHDTTYSTANPVFEKSYVFVGKNTIAYPDKKTIKTEITNQDTISRALKHHKGSNDYIHEYISMYPIMSNSRTWLFIDPTPALLEQSATRLMYRHCADMEDEIADEIDKRLVVSAEEAELLPDTVAYNSKSHLLMCLFAEKIIVSDPNEIVRLKNLFGLINAEFVYLPNNVLSLQDKPQLQKLTGTPIETIAIVAEEERMLLPTDKLKAAACVLGNPKFDALVDNKNPRVLFMPSYRKHLYLGKNKYNNAFKDSEYAIKIGDLLLEEQFLDVADALNIKVDFAPHENTYAQLPDFDMDESIMVVPPNTPRFGMCQNAAMLITDTLPAYGFAYLGKPVVYYQFDTDGTTPQDGARFGECVSNFDELVLLLADYMQNGFALKPQYQQEAERFFAHTRRVSCQLIYKRLTEAKQ